MSDDRLEQCRRRLDELDDAELDDGALDARADGLEFVHGTLVAELDDLLDRDRRR